MSLHSATARIGKSYRRARVAVLTVGGFTSLSCAAFTWNVTAGLVAVGASLMALAWVSESSEGNDG